MKGFDLNFSEAKAAEFKRRFDLRKARKQQVVVLRLGLPLVLIVVGALHYHLWHSFTAETYAYLAIAWFGSAPVRRYWQIAASIRLDAKEVALGFKFKVERAFSTNSAWEATKRYYKRGFARSGSTKKVSGLFVGRLRWLNKFGWLWQWALHLRVLGPVCLEGLASLIWPLTAVVMVAHHCYEALQLKGVEKPWWGRRYVFGD